MHWINGNDHKLELTSNRNYHALWSRGGHAYSTHLHVYIFVITKNQVCSGM